LDARKEQSGGEDHEEKAGAVGDIQHFGSIDSHIIRHNSPADAETHYIDCEEPSPCKEEAVETDRLLLFFGRTRRSVDGGDGDEAREGCDEGNPEEKLEIVGGVVYPYPYRGGESHGEVIAQAIEPYSFVSARRGEHVYRHCGIGHCYRPERQPVERAHYGEHQECACTDIAGEKDKESEEAEHEHLFTVESIDYESAERAHQEGCHYIARKHKPHHVFIGGELRVEIYRQEGRKDIE
jgi:hypothetical protein